jgi:Tol biopolymer transport system component/DNA-binding winged helix-turn-helix (wHTH) protein
MATGTGPVYYEFGGMRLDPTERLLLRDGQPVSLTPKAFDLLVYLVEHHGRLVEKSTLIAALWPDTTVEEANLAFQISALRKALHDAGNGETLIQTVPTRGYRFVGVVEERLSAAPAQRSPWRPRQLGLLILLATVGAPLLLIGVRFLAGSKGTTPPANARVVQLTTETGVEFHPAFSPDGTQIVYSRLSKGCPSRWCGPQSEHSGLWQMVVGSADVRQLTTGAGFDVNARFSPDGRQVAFVRRQDQLGRRRIMLVSAVGGPAAKLSDFPAADAAIAWSGDGKVIIAGRDPVDDPRGDRGLYAVPLAGRALRAITRASPPMVHVDPALSPDGRRLAFVACRSAVLMRFDCDLNVADIAPDLTMTSPPRRVVTMPMISGPVWGPDGRSLIFTGDPEGGFLYLWKLDPDRLGSPERIESAGRNVGEQVAVAQGGRLAFSRVEEDWEIVRIAIGQPPVTLISSSSVEAQGTYSEDGRRIAFSSDRSGPGAIRVWVAEADGSAPRQLTHGPNLHDASPKWSPDGKRIAFDAQSADGHTHIRVADAEGGATTRLTFGPEDQNLPFWSRDGQWVYYAGGHGQGIARVPARGGAPEPIITGGSGLIASESTDGRSILYQPKEGDSPLLERSLAGGPVRQVLPCVQAGAFAVHAKGIYYIPCGAGPDPVVHLLGASDHRDRPVFSLKAYGAYAGWSLSVSPDGNAMLYTTTVSMRGDLWMIENFR